MAELQEIMEGLMTELKRGTIVLCVLSSLQEKQYGYSLSQALEEKGITVDQNTLYPLLRRLEKQQLLQSDWILEDNRPRRYYMLNENGKMILQQLKNEWEKISRSIEQIISGKEGR